MSNTTNRYFLGVVKLNVPFRVEQVELAPLVFVSIFTVMIFVMAGIDTPLHIGGDIASENHVEIRAYERNEQPPHNNAYAPHHW